MRVLRGFVARMSAGYGSDADSVQAGGSSFCLGGFEFQFEQRQRLFCTQPATDFGMLNKYEQTVNVVGQLLLQKKEGCHRRCRETAIDAFLRSLAVDQQQLAIGVVLSGPAPIDCVLPPEEMLAVILRCTDILHRLICQDDSHVHTASNLQHVSKWLATMR